MFIRIDRVLCNEDWIDFWSDFIVIFLSEGIFYYISVIVIMNGQVWRGKSFFKYFIWWKNIKGFNDQVKECWEKFIEGNSMYCLIRKMKR